MAKINNSLAALLVLWTAVRFDIFIMNEQQINHFVNIWNTIQIRGRQYCCCRFTERCLFFSCFSCESSLRRQRNRKPSFQHILELWIFNPILKRVNWWFSLKSFNREFWFAVLILQQMKFLGRSFICSVFVPIDLNAEWFRAPKKTSSRWTVEYHKTSFQIKLR